MESPPGMRVLTALLLAVAVASAAPTDDDRKPFALDDFVNARFSTRGFAGTWVADNLLRFYNSSTREVSLYDVETSSYTTLIPSDVLKQYTDGSIASYSKDGKLVAISYETEKIYRHSTKSKFAIYDTESGKTYSVDTEKLRTLVWAGDRSILWVKDNNVYYRENALTDKPGIAITTDGREGVIFNGIPDWVYEEEVLASGSAMWPSPDGSKLAFASFVDTRVNHTFYFEYGPATKDAPVQQYPKMIDITYPKAGTPNPDVRLRVVDLQAVASTGQVTLVDVPAPVDKVTSDHILYGCFWTSNRVLASWTNRVQNVNIISSCDMQGSCREALAQEEKAGWVDPPALKMHSSGRLAAAVLPHDDRPHLAIVTFAEDNQERASVTFLTSGLVTVLGILGWDEARGFLYFVQTETDDPAKRHVYRVLVPGEDSNHVNVATPTCLTCDIVSPEKNKCSYGSATFSSGFNYVVLGCLGPDPAFYGLYRVQDKPSLLRTWDDNVEVRALLATRLRPEIEDLWLPVANGAFRARVRLLIPPKADRSGATKYPMLIYVYAGPDSNQVTSAFSVQFGDYLSSSRNIVYALIDGRGSGRNGRKLMHAVYRNLGTVEIQDQINVADQLKKKFSFIDPDRTAIWGWSYGGFSTAHAMAQDKDQVFCCGVSVAPVTSFIFYDTIYTERYMGLPTEADNLAGYNQTDVTRNVANFKNKKYLLIHGNADDNVHYQQSMHLSRALEEADILFQQQSYPDEAHALAGVKKHVYHTMDDFWTRAFHLPRPEYSKKSR